MNAWPDEKIYNNAIWDIRRSSMTPEQWRCTRIENHYEQVLESLECAEGERIVVSAITSDTHWYALTTRRLVGVSRDGAFDVAAHLMTNCTFGDNPKGHNDVQLSIAKISQCDGVSATFEFETGKAWMAPQNYVSWWIRKFPILDVFKFDPAAK